MQLRKPRRQQSGFARQCIEPARSSLCAGFGRFQACLLGYAGLAWAADACEMMLLSFVGPAVRIYMLQI